MEVAISLIREAAKRGSKELDLSKLKLTQLPEEIGQLTGLQRLNLARNKLGSLPEVVLGLVELQYLNLSRNDLTQISTQLLRLHKLHTLNLSRNKLTIFPSEVCELHHLENLSLGRNQLTSLPDKICNINNLRTLILVHNKLSALPDTIGNLSELRGLSLSTNQLRSLPAAIGKLTKLTQLVLGENQLEKLPETISELRRLKIIDASYNVLSSLPESIGNLPFLRNLCLRKNKLTVLPNTIQRLDCLKIIDLRGNPALGIPEEILARHKQLASEILKYYFAFAAKGEEGRALREVKLIVVGRGGAGKTSLVKLLKGEPFDPQESETHGITILPLIFKCKDGPVQARIWDFGGQHVLHAMHEFFLTARSIYMLVLGERDDMAERDALYWLQLIRSYAGNAPVVVVLNKSHGGTREMDRRSLEEKFGPIVGWVATECSETDMEVAGINHLRSILTGGIARMEEIRRLFPGKWFQIKNWLASMKESYIDYATYALRCTELGEPDREKQEELAGWLHDLGIALNYGRDPRLRDTTILRPDWLANGIYAILRANDSRHPEPLAYDGVVSVDNIGQIYAAAETLRMLEAKDYPEDKWLFILRLMGLFQLSFPLDEKGYRQLVPALLPLEEPPNVYEPRGAGCVRIRYEFSVVPAPLVPKLLVRTFGLIHHSLHWRRGAMLSYGPATAKVWSTQDERWIYLSVGSAEGDEARDDLVTIVRGTLRSLFAEYKRLSVVEQYEWKGEWVPRTTLEHLGVLKREQTSRTDSSEHERWGAS